MSMSWRCAFVLFAALHLLAPALRATPADGDRTPAARPGAVVDPALFQAMQYRLVGPYRGGRVVAVAGVPDAPRTFYMGGTGGGVWKTTDGGASWRNVSDGFFTSGSIGAIAVAPSDPNVVYVGTGEACIRGNVSPGDGVYKSIDGGKTWTHTGLKDAGQIPRIRVHTRNPDLVYVAAFGHAFGPNSERGIFRSSDGGKTWERVLFVSDRAGAADLAMDVTNPRVLYAAIWEAVRKPWTLISGGKDSGLYRSVDGGDTWELLAQGLPSGIKGRMGVTVSPANPSRVWAIVEAEEGGVYRSDDAGATFTRVNSDKALLGRPFYYMHIYADPRDPEKVYSMGHGNGFFRSLDGGKTFDTSIQGHHGDYHDLWLNPADPRIMVNGNDGGASVSFDGGASWSDVMNQPTAEIYRVDTDNEFLYRLYGAQQDNTTVSIPSRTTDIGILERHWYPVGGCEQGHVAVNPRDPNIVYAGCYEGIIERYDHRTGETRNIMAYPEYGEGVPARSLKYRFQMNAPIRVSLHDPGVLYHTSNVVHRSANEGQSWTIISPDLTRDDKDKQGPSGGPITRDHTGPETYCTIFAFEESPLQRGLLWAGSDDGLVHVSHDAGARWENVTPKGMPEWGTVNMIHPSRHDPGRAFIAVHRYRDNDPKPYIFRTNDAGRSWTLLTSGTNGIPPTHFVRVVREDPVRKGLLYAGTEFGMYVSFDDGQTWQPFQLNLPVVPVTDMMVKNNSDLVLATQGRSFWILDDLTPLQQLTPAVMKATPAHLFQPRETYRMAGTSVDAPNVGRNPPNGVVVYYELASVPREPVTIDFLDSVGTHIKSFSSGGADDPSAAAGRRRYGRAERVTTRAGMNRFVWDLRYPDARTIPGAVLAGSTRGPKAVPGRYQVRVRVGDWTQTRSFEIKADPRLETTLEGFARQFSLATELLERVTRAHDTAAAIRDLRRQVQELVERPGAASEVAAAAARLGGKLSAIEQALVDPRLAVRWELIHYEPVLDSHLIGLYEMVTGADATPTAGALERFADLQAEMDAQLAALQQVIDRDLPVLNRLARDRQVPAVAVPSAIARPGSL